MPMPHWKYVAALCVGLMFAAPAQAQTMKYGVPGFGQEKPEMETKWTSQDLEMMCRARNPGGDNRLKSCIERNRYRVGRLMNMGDIQEMESARAMQGATGQPPKVKPQQKTQGKPQPKPQAKQQQQKKVQQW